MIAEPQDIGSSLAVALIPTCASSGNWVGKGSDIQVEIEMGRGTMYWLVKGTNDLHLAYYKEQSQSGSIKALHV